MWTRIYLNIFLIFERDGREDLIVFLKKKKKDFVINTKINSPVVIYTKINCPVVIITKTKSPVVINTKINSPVVINTKINNPVTAFSPNIKDNFLDIYCKWEGTCGYINVSV